MAGWPELVERGLAAYNRLDAAAFAALCTPDAELFPRIVLVEGGRPFGRDDVEAWFGEIRGSFEFVRTDAERIHDLGEAAVLEARARNRGLASGAEVDMPVAALMRRRGDLLREFAVHRDRDAAARALGFQSLNVALVARHHEAWTAREYEGTTALMHPDIEWDTRPGVPDGAAGRGIDAATEFTRSWFGAWKDWTFEPLEYVDAPPHVLARCRLDATGRASGVRVLSEIFQLWTFEDARAVRYLHFQDEAAARAAAGLSQPQSE